MQAATGGRGEARSDPEPRPRQSGHRAPATGAGAQPGRQALGGLHAETPLEACLPSLTQVPKAAPPPPESPIQTSNPRPGFQGLEREKAPNEHHCA